MNSAYASLAPLYDRLMSDVDYDAWTRYLQRLIRRFLPSYSPMLVLECACGTGEMTRRLLDAGFVVVASDRSPEMLAVAREKLRLAGYAGAAVVQQDMRALQAHKPADVVLAACDGVNYLTEDGDAAQFFRSAHAALKPGGLLLFDVSSAWKLKTVLDGRTFGETFSDFAYLWQNVFDSETGLLGMDLTFFTKQTGGLYLRSEESQIQRAFEADELCDLMRAAGFEVAGVLDAFTENDATAESERIQFVARRI